MHKNGFYIWDDNPKTVPNALSSSRGMDMDGSSGREGAAAGKAAAEGRDLFV